MAEINVKGKVSLKEKIARKSLVVLQFIGISIQKTQEGEDVAILQLAEPIPHVRGSQEVEFNGKRVPIEEWDVTEVKVPPSVIDKYEENFSFDEDPESDAGEYRGNKLILDVAKNSRQVWLVEKSFAASGQEMSRNNREDRLSKLLKVQEEQRQAKLGKQGAQGPTPVETP